MTGRGIAARPSNARRNVAPIVRAAAWSPNSLMSAPAARAFSEPSTTTAFTVASARRSSAASPIAVSIACESGFIGGRLSRSATTPPGNASRSTRSSVMLAVLVTHGPRAARPRPRADRAHAGSRASTTSSNTSP